MQTVFFFLKKLTNWLFIFFPLPYIFKDISKSINHTEMVQLFTKTSMYNVPIELYVLLNMLETSTELPFSFCT